MQISRPKHERILESANKRSRFGGTVTLFVEPKRQLGARILRPLLACSRWNHCANPFRFDIFDPTAMLEVGCLHAPANSSGEYVTPNNDGVVCRDSAVYSKNSPNPPGGAPSVSFESPDYVHTKTGLGFGSVLIMGCSSPSGTEELFRPPASNDVSSLFQAIVGLINANQ